MRSLAINAVSESDCSFPRSPSKEIIDNATAALMGGVNLAYISRQLGHKSPAMFKLCSKWIGHGDFGRETAKLSQIYG